MGNIIPIYEAGESLTDEELAAQFMARTGIPKSQLIGLIAKRSPSNPALLDILEQEALDAGNRKEKFFGFIKLSWIPVLAVLDHGSDDAKGKLHGWLQQWSEEERSLFL